MRASTSRPGIVYPILAFGLVSFAFSPILVRFASGAPGLAIAVWRTLFAALLLAPAALPVIRAEVRAFTRRDVGLIVVAGVLLGVHFVIWIESLYHTSVASASVLVTTSPIFLALLGYFFLRERLTVREVSGIALAVLGAGLLGWGDAGDVTKPNALLGNSLALSAAVLVSVYMLIGRVVRQRTSWLAYVFPLYTVVSLTTLACALLRGTPLLGYGLPFYGLCALMALGPQIIGHGSFNFALRYFPAAVLGLLSLLEPVGAALLAYFLFGEVPSWISVVGILIVLLAVSFALVRRRRRIPAVEPSALEP